MEANKKSPITTFVCFDIETTGLNPLNDKIIEIGAIKVVDKKIAGIFSELINPGMKLSPAITKLTGINDEMLVYADNTDNVIRRFLEFTENHIVIGHNIMFDYSFIKTAATLRKLEFEKYGIDTLELSRKLRGDLESRSLENMCKYYKIKNERAHRAYADAKATALLYTKLCNDFFEEYPEVFISKPLIYKMKKTRQITKKQKNYLIDLLKYHNIVSVQPLDNLTQSEASRRIDQIILNNGRMS